MIYKLKHLEISTVLHKIVNEDVLCTWTQCSIYHLHACTYAGDFDPVQVTLNNLPAHMHVEF